MKMAPKMAKTDVILVNLSGRGDKDMGILARELNLKGAKEREQGSGNREQKAGTV